MYATVLFCIKLNFFKTLHLRKLILQIKNFNLNQSNIFINFMINLSCYNNEGLKVLMNFTEPDIEFYKNKILETNEKDSNFSIFHSRLVALYALKFSINYHLDLKE